ncbi:MAG: D-TA family PLP-dependent enzyme [Rhodothermales bacterium]|nr:D-TA family PLP-dependent enzyme [Rhodothermales bacterium]
MESLLELPTPALLIEHSRMMRNLDRMQELANAQSCDLRPHTKTHKSVDLAARQIEKGASGLTVAKVGEAEVYVDHGFEDIFLAYAVIGEEKYRRLLNLMGRATISFCVDTLEGARQAGQFFSSAGNDASVVVEVDAGYHRCGLPWDSNEIVQLCQQVDKSPGLRFQGIMTHAGHSYKGPSSDSETHRQALERVASEERDRMIELADRLAQEGLKPAVVSIGSTPTMSAFENRTSSDGQTITEIRPGNYIFNDAIQVGLGVASLEECALTVLATVISVQADSNGRERLFLDAGKKIFTSDTGYGTDGYGTLLYNARTMTKLPHATLHSLSEEHGWVSVSGAATFDVGDRVRVVPNHACVVMNNQPQVFMVDGQDIVGKIRVDAINRVV